MDANAEVAQLVEQWIENPCVGGSSPPLGTTFANLESVSLINLRLTDFCFDSKFDNNWGQNGAKVSSLTVFLVYRRYSINSPKDWLDSSVIRGRCMARVTGINEERIEKFRKLILDLDPTD